MYCTVVTRASGSDPLKNEALIRDPPTAALVLAQRPPCCLMYPASEASYSSGVEGAPGLVDASPLTEEVLPNRTVLVACAPL